MLLRQEDCDGIAVLSVTGSVGEVEADGLVTAAERLRAAQPGGVVVDLTAAPTLTSAAQRQLSALLDLPSGWPRSPLVVCPDSALPGAPAAMTAADRDAAVATVRDRGTRPRTRLVVPHDPTGPAAARAAVCGSGQLGLSGVCDEVALVISEMVTNAVRHAAPPVHLEVETTDDDVLIAVCDGSPVTPEMRAPDDDAEGGRGMVLVDLIAVEHGVRVQPPGKTVWARIGRHG